ncbi:MAG TPA: IS110 family transposase [Acidimicrobiales bacterium]|nr:IS110 family transposase [Acidimicrobiales bacterium]
MTSLAHRGYIHLGMDVSRDSIALAILGPDSDVAITEKIPSDPESVRRLIKRVGRPSGIWACYEAGPTGYELYRLLRSMKVRCDVIAPSLVPKGRGDRVKTDKRDSRRLAGLHRAGQLTPVAVPSPAQEAVRDLCRTRGQMVSDLTRARNRLTHFLLRHGLVHRDGSKWTQRHHAWLAAQHFDDAALVATYRHYRATVALRDNALDDVEADLRAYFGTAPFADAAVRLGGYRGMTHMGGLCIGAEVFDWRRFPKARSFMAFTGLTCWEDSTGLSEHRGSITRAGNSRIRAQLVEAAWAYQHQPAIGETLRQRLALVGPATSARSWSAQTRLCRRFHALAQRKNLKSKVATAVARELAGFLWAEMTAAA